MAYEALTPPGPNLVSLTPPVAQAPGLDAGSFFNSRPSLPPEEYLDRPSERIPTPVDEYGLIKVPELLQSVRDMVSPEYEWPIGRSEESTHHIYWRGSNYPYEQGNPHSPGTFRNLPMHLLELPRVFENLLHVVTEEPPVPSREVMEYQIEAWRVARLLFKSTHKMVVWEKRARRRLAIGEDVSEYEGDAYAPELTSRLISRHGRGLERHMAELERIPPEFRLVEPCNSPHSLATELGRVVRQQSLLTSRYVHGEAPLAVAWLTNRGE